MTATVSSEVRVGGPPTGQSGRVLTPDGLAVVGRLHAEFGERRQAWVRRRPERGDGPQHGGASLTLATDGPALGEWLVAPAPKDLDNRRVEITGPAEPKMMINALNSGASVFMADLEDALSPTWANVVDGQGALIDAVRRSLKFESPEGKSYELKDRLATLVVRPRGWHLDETHLRIGSVP